MSETLTRRRMAHHGALQALAQTVNCSTPGISLWRKLSRLERKVSSACEAYSSDADYGLAKWEQVKDDARQELAKIFGGTIPTGVFINSDPRGYALQLDCDKRGIPEGMDRNLGGNGILAPQID